MSAPASPAAEPRFPLLDGPSVPWHVVAPHEGQAKRNHGQTLERLAQRGGLSCAEFWFVMNDKEWPRSIPGEAVEVVSDRGHKLAQKLISDSLRADALQLDVERLVAEVERLRGELAEERLLWPTPGHLERACARFIFYVIDHGTISPPAAATYFDLMRKALEESREERGKATVAHEELPALRAEVERLRGGPPGAIGESNERHQASHPNPQL